MPVEVSPTGQIQEFLAVIKRRRWQILLPALFVFTFGSAFAVLIPKKYVIETRIELTETRNPLDYIGRNRQEAATTREAPNVVEHVIHFQRIKSIVSQELIGKWPEYQRGDRATQHSIITAIMDNLEVDTIAKPQNVGSTYVDIAYGDTNAERAVAFLSRINRYWFDEVRAQAEAELENERDVYAESERLAEATYQEASERWGELSREMRHNPALPPDTRNANGNGAASDFIYDTLRDYQKQKQANDVELSNARAELELRNEAYEDEPEQVSRVRVGEGENFTRDIAKARAAVEKLESELSRITPRNSQYQAKRERIATILEQIRAFETEQIASQSVDVMISNEKREELRARWREQAGKVDLLESTQTHLLEKIEEFSGRAGQRSNDYLRMQDLWAAREESRKSLTEASATLRLKESAIALNKETANSGLRVTMEPEDSGQKAEPSTLLLVAFALFMGLALGMVVALVAEYGRNSYRTIGDLAGVMDVPVLGAIGGIATRRELRRLRARRVVVGLSSAVILVSVALMVYVWSDDDLQGMLPVSVLQAIESFRLKLM